MMAPSTHETDSYARANEQVRPSRAGRLLEADIETIAEGGESMGRGEKREPVNRLALPLTHLPKWRFQPGLRGNGWQLRPSGASDWPSTRRTTPV